MIPIRIGLCPAVVLFLLAAPASGQDHFVASSFLFTPAPAPPAALSWRLATGGDDFVELVVPPVTHSSNQIVHFVTPDNAIDYGLDFGAWTAAVNDPSYNRSIMSFGGVIQEKPWSNPWSGGFELERVQLFVNNFDPRFDQPSVQGGIVDFIPVPEPTTCWLMAFYIGVPLSARRSSSRALIGKAGLSARHPHDFQRTDHMHIQQNE